MKSFVFRGVLLARLQDVFRQRDWIANGLSRPVPLVSAVVDARRVVEGIFLEANPTKRFQSAWMGIIVHSAQSVVAIGVVLALVLK